MSKAYFSSIMFQPLKYYIAIVGIIGLLIYATLMVFASTVVGKNFATLGIMDSFTHPKRMFEAAIKDTVSIEATALPERANAARIEKHCQVDGCYLLLLSEQFERDSVALTPVSEPTKIAGKSENTFAWLIPAQLTNDYKNLASEIGPVIWDETRQIIIYQAVANLGKEPVNKLFIWDYTKSWGFGLLHWVDLSLPTTHIEVTGYDQNNGFITLDHFNNADNTLIRDSHFSVTDPELQIY